MGEDVIQRGIQFPRPLYDELSKIAKIKSVSFAAIVREACIQYLDASTPGLCPKCHTQNLPDAQYCQKCSEPLTEESIKELKRIQMLMLDPELIQRIFTATGIERAKEDTEIGKAINVIHSLQSQIDELKTTMDEWTKKKMEEELKKD